MLLVADNHGFEAYQRVALVSRVPLCLAYFFGVDISVASKKYLFLGNFV